jgi:hypothetical protein
MSFDDFFSTSYYSFSLQTDLGGELGLTLIMADGVLLVIYSGEGPKKQILDSISAKNLVNLFVVKNILA